MNNKIKGKKINYLVWLFFLLFSISFSFSIFPQVTSIEWLSLKYDKTYLRSGPSKKNKVLWTYKKKGLPIKVIRKKEVSSSKVIAKVGKNVIGELISCQKKICKVDYYKVEGFVEKKFLWGVD